MSKVVKNTALLYIRSIVVLLITLYTSRVLLSALGVEDYGLYSIVGGVVGLFGSLKGLFAFAVQRYLSFAKGENDVTREKLVFNVSFILHIFIAFVFAIIVESFGSWFIANKLNIPEGSYSDAYFVFHLSVLTAVTSILMTPYSASIIANEKMGVFAWISIVDALLKLFIILLIPIIAYIPIRTYAILIFAVEALNFTLYFINCRKFPECKFEKKFDKDLFKDMASFAGWDFAGNTAWALINEGVNMVLNVFGGVTVNAARGIAYQVKHAVIMLVNNVTVASRPFIVKQAASETKEITFKSINLMARALFLTTVLTALPLIVYAKQVLSLWLVEVPDYAVSFVQLVLLWNIVRTMNTPIDIAFTAYGKMKKYQIFNAMALLLNLPIAYLFLSLGYSYNYAMLTFVLVEVVDIVVNSIVAQKEIDFDIKQYLKTVVVRNIFNTIVLGIISIVFYLFLNPSGFFLYTAFCVLLLVLIAGGIIFLLLSKEEKAYISPIVKRLVNKIR